MIPPIPQIVPLDLWADLLGALNTMMAPLYWAVSWVMTTFHALFASFLGADSGWAWALAELGVVGLAGALTVLGGARLTRLEELPYVVRSVLRRG